MKKVIIMVIVALLLTGCADQVTFDQAKNIDPVGFWHGVWHGMTCFFSIFWVIFF